MECFMMATNKKLGGKIKKIIITIFNLPFGDLHDDDDYDEKFF